MKTQPVEILNVNELATVAGGQAAACNFLVENVKSAIKDSYPHDSHDYGAQRMASYGSAMNAVNRACLQRQGLTGDEPSPSGRPKP